MAEKTIASNATRWAREYETIYILRPNVAPEDAKRVSDRVLSVMEKGGAKLLEVETWGLRRLAYSIQKHRRGIFIYVKFAAYSDVPAELERNLRLLDPVIRYQTIVLTQKVDLEAVEVDGEAVFEDLEQQEEEEELSTAVMLGMEEPAPPKAEGEEDVTDAAAADEAEARGEGSKGSEEE